MWGVQLQVVHVEIEAVHIGGFMVSLKKRCDASDLSRLTSSSPILEGMIQVCFLHGTLKKKHSGGKRYYVLLNHSVFFSSWNT